MTTDQRLHDAEQWLDREVDFLADEYGVSDETSVKTIYAEALELAANHIVPRRSPTTIERLTIDTEENRMNTSPDLTRITIRPNNYGTSRARCALCGQPTEASIPVVAFLAGTYHDVCRDCADEHTPGLTQTLDAAYAQTPSGIDEADYYRQVEAKVETTPWWEDRQP